MKFRILARSKDSYLLNNLINQICLEKGDCEFNIDYQEFTESFVLDIKTENENLYNKIKSIMKQLNIEDTKSIGIIGGV